jgi:hypothetical protein
MDLKMSTQEQWYPPKANWLGNAFGCPPFDVVNQMLYQAVKDNPDNDEPAQIIGKLMLIGRTYSASVERRKTNGTAKDERQALDVIIEAAHAIAQSDVHDLLAKIPRPAVLSLRNIDQATAIHAQLCKALSAANKRENSSLASKYLHFHRPNFFPIVDSLARLSWSWVMDARGESYRGYTTFGKVARYGEWCKKVLNLQNDMKAQFAHDVSLRQVDNYLLSIMSLDGKGGWGLPVLINQVRAD